MVRDGVPITREEYLLPRSKKLTILAFTKADAGFQREQGAADSITGVPPCRLFCVMADKCVPAECLMALPKKKQ